MPARYRLTSVETVEEDGSWVFTAQDDNGENVEVVLVPCEGNAGVSAWINRCTHEDQRLHREGVGAIIRDGGIVCPRHGSVFDGCSGGCANGPATGSTLPAVDIVIDDGAIYLTDDRLSYITEGHIDDEEDDTGPSSTSHLRF